MLRLMQIDEAPSMFPGRQASYLKRKLIEFAPEVWLALGLLAKDTGRSVQDLATRPSPICSANISVRLR